MSSDEAYLSEVFFGLGLNVIPGVLADQAAIGLFGARETSWQTDMLNQALEYCYNSNPPDLTPQIYPAYHNGEGVGFVVVPEVDTSSRYRMSNEQLFQILLEAITSNREAVRVGDSITFVKDDGVATGGYTLDDDRRLAVVSYRDSLGVAFPYRAVNYALWQMMSQDAWPTEDDGALFMAEVRKGSDEPTAGLILASRQLLQDLKKGGPYADDTLFAQIREIGSKVSDVFPEFTMKGFR